jgi:MFS family permease
VTTVGSLLASIQGSALLIALPQTLTLPQADFLTLMWVLLGYLLLTTALMPMIGRLADMFGRKNIYGSGFAVFTLGSFLSGLSQPQFHGWYLVGYRLVRGIGGSLLFTNSAAIVTDAFRTGRVGLGLGVNKITFAAGFPWAYSAPCGACEGLGVRSPCLKPSNSIGWDSSHSPLA